MKKLFAAVLTTALMTFGLVATASGPASAACGYPQCIKSTTVASAKSPLRVGKKPKIKVVVGAPGNVDPTGSVKVVVKRVGGGYQVTRTIPYTGNALTIKTRRANRTGLYTVKVRFESTNGSIFTNSRDNDDFRVAR